MKVTAPVKYTSSEKYLSAKGVNVHVSFRRRCTILKQYFTKIIALRTLLVGSLVVAAVLCSILSYFTLKQSEKHLFESQYKSVSESALNEVVDSFAQMNLGLQEMAASISHTFPNSSAWPNVAWSGFYPAATLLGQMAQLDNIIFSPIVLPEDLPSYRTFLENYYTNEPYIPKPVPHPPNLALGDVWALNLETLEQYSDTTGYTPLSANLLLSPAAQVTFSNFLGPVILAYNLHSDPRFTRTIDAVIACAGDSSNYTDASTKCGAVSDAVPFPQPTPADLYPQVEDYVALLAHPIFPAGNQSHLAGFVEGAMGWKSLLKKVVPPYVTGIDCVIKTGTQEFTYTIVNGAPMLLGVGDFHERKYSSYRRSRTLRSDRVTADAGSYEVNFYPRSGFEREYISMVPMWGAILLILVFLFCSVVFLCYDWLMQRESGRKQAVLDTKRRFVRFISHEIRTPLNTVRLGLNLLESELVLAAARVSATSPALVPALVLDVFANWTQLTADVLSNSESAVEVLDDLLNYDKIEMGNLRLEFAQFNIHTLVRQTTSFMQIQAQQKNITLHLQGDSMQRSEAQNANVVGSMVVGDVSRMGQVLRNLISNALKFTPTDGDVKIIVEIVQRGLPEDISSSIKGQAAQLFASSVRAGSICISVKDSGAGLSTKQLRTICTEGVQFNANELQAGQGSGLGLFISKGIVEQHGGKLTVSSEGLGKGVTFTVELPLFEGLADEKPEDNLVTPFGSIPQGSPALRLHKVPTFTSESGSRQSSAHLQHMLVVDDSHFNRKMLVRLLTSKGYLCEQAENGVEAIDMYHAMEARGDKVDTILMDFEMPVMNGPTATKKLRELGCTCLIVGVTGNVLPEEQAFFRKNGADAVLPKPFKIDKFDEVLLRHRSGARCSSVDSADSVLGFSVKPSFSPRHRAVHNNSRIHPEENV